MKTKINLLDAIDKDIYSIFTDYDGVKKIKFWGYVYDAGNEDEDGNALYTSVEISWCKTSVREFLSEEFDLGDFEANFKQHYNDRLTKEDAQRYLDEYFGVAVFPADTVHSPEPLLLSKVSEDTPDGDYIDM